MMKDQHAADRDRSTVGPMSLVGPVRFLQATGAMVQPHISVASGGLRPIRPEAWATWTIGAAVVEEADSSEGLHVATVAVLPVFGLVEVKRAYDPDNLFHLNQNIRP